MSGLVFDVSFKMENLLESSDFVRFISATTLVGGFVHSSVSFRTLPYWKERMRKSSVISRIAFIHIEHAVHNGLIYL